MKTKSTVIISLVIVILCVFSMILLRETPVLSPWKNWKVLSVEISIPEKTVLSELSKISVDTVVSESSQRLKINSEFSPVLPSEFNFYQDNLYRYFYDKYNNYRLYYLPKTVKNRTLKALPFDYNIDLQASFPYFSFILTVISFIVLIFLIKNKLLFSISLLPMLLFTVVFPDFHSLVISLFSFIIVYFADKYINRKNILSALINNRFVILSFAICIISSILGGFKGIFLFFLTLISCIGLNLIISWGFSYLDDKKNRLKFTKIVSASGYNFYNKKLIYLFYGLSGFILIGALSYIFIPSISNKTNKDTPLLIPTPLEYTNTRGFSIGSYSNLQTKKSPTELPDLGDYVSQIWNATVFPFIPFAKGKGYISNVTPETSVNTIEYFEENGIIKTKSVEVAVFSKDFINAALDNIKSSDRLVIENVLLDQESFCASDFGNVKRTTTLTLILFIIALIFSGAEIFIFYKFYKIGC